MRLINTVTETLKASTESATRSGESSDNSKGAYWCHDCEERIRDINIEGKSPPDYPECDETMEFERSPSSTGCAC
jgi:hypothetical protein